MSIATNVRGHKFGRTLKLYLVDGSPSGVIKAELGNWSGKVLVASRSVLPDLIKQPETTRTGVYLLIGPDPTSSSRTLVYVGEGDAVRRRLISHDKDDAKEFFTRICVIVSKDENLTKAHGRYLESRILALIHGAARASAVNGNQPEFSGLPEAEIADMEGFLSELEVLLPVLGFDLLRKGADAEAIVDAGASTLPTFLLTQGGATGRAREAGGEFVVLAGSTARVKETPTCPDGIQTLRRELLDDGALVVQTDEQFYRFERDVPFPSPSSAASTVYGGSLSGRKRWKVEGSKLSYGEWRDQSLAAAEDSM